MGELADGETGRVGGVGDHDAVEIQYRTGRRDDWLHMLVAEEGVEADKTFNMLMGDEVAPRKRFIESHAKNANLDV